MWFVVLCQIKSLADVTCAIQHADDADVLVCGFKNRILEALDEALALLFYSNSDIHN